MIEDEDELPERIELDVIVRDCPVCGTARAQRWLGALAGATVWKCTACHHEERIKADGETTYHVALDREADLIAGIPLHVRRRILTCIVQAKSLALEYARNHSRAECEEHREFFVVLRALDGDTARACLAVLFDELDAALARVAVEELEERLRALREEHG